MLPPIESLLDLSYFLEALSKTLFTADTKTLHRIFSKDWRSSVTMIMDLSKLDDKTTDIDILYLYDVGGFSYYIKFDWKEEHSEDVRKMFEIYKNPFKIAAHSSMSRMI